MDQELNQTGLHSLGLVVTCPYCGHKADDSDFGVSLEDECWCPKCGREFMLAEDEEE